MRRPSRVKLNTHYVVNARSLAHEVNDSYALFMSTTDVSYSDPPLIIPPSFFPAGNSKDPHRSTFIQMIVSWST
jgi:hypothetical protein